MNVAPKTHWKKRAISAQHVADQATQSGFWVFVPFGVTPHAAGLSPSEGDKEAGNVGHRTRLGSRPEGVGAPVARFFRARPRFNKI